MLVHIQIRDFAIIDTVELELGSGLTVLTGETGAGKSILVDALLLAAGGRAGAEVVRHGAERAEVAATFSVTANRAALAWLNEQAVDHDGECILRRVVGADGRSRAFVNGQAMPVQSLRQLGETLLDVHGQMEYQSLVRRAAQRDLLDRSGNHDAPRADVAACWRQWSALRAERDQAAASVQDREARLELLRYHARELAILEPKAGEYAELAAERQRVSQRSRLAAGAREIIGLLREGEESNAEQSVSRALTLARTLTDLDARFAQIAALIDESLIALREGVESIERYESALDADPQRQEWIEQRLAALESTARKHRIEPATLHELQIELQHELQRLETIEASLEQIDLRLAQSLQRFRSACATVSAARAQAASSLSERVTALMQTLGMPGGRFAINVQTSEDTAGVHGADEIEFLVSANPGQPPKPLAKVASGGELSRISLAIQVAAAHAAQDDSPPCLVFDEVDAGVGGGVAEIVGRQLRALAERGGEHAQALCVTHLPQVAGQAHAHVRVTKLTDGRTTRTSLHPLSHNERIEEIARMLGGVSVTDKAREHAAEMLATSVTAKKKKSAAKR